MSNLLSLLRSCVDDYQMIKEGDRIVVGVSGGKDSLTLLHLMARLQSFYPKHFSLAAVSVDLGLPGMDFTPVEEFSKELEVPFQLIKTEIGPIIFEYRKEKNPCSMCAKMRRGALDRAVKELGFNKLALGHHYDDAAETFLMSLIYEGRLSCFQPVTYLDRTDVTQIRPMLYISERAITHFADEQKLPVVYNVCPADKQTKRQEIKELLYELCGRYPHLKDHIFHAMQRLPLPEWGVASEKQLQRQKQSQSRQPEDAHGEDGDRVDMQPDAGESAEQIHK